MKSWVQIVVIVFLILLSIWMYRKHKRQPAGDNSPELPPDGKPIAGGIPLPEEPGYDPTDQYPSNWDKFATPPIVGDNTSVYNQPVY